MYRNHPTLEKLQFENGEIDVALVWVSPYEIKIKEKKGEP